METKNLLNKKITQWLLLVAMLIGCSANAWAADCGSTSVAANTTIYVDASYVSGEFTNVYLSLVGYNNKEEAGYIKNGDVSGMNNYGPKSGDTWSYKTSTSKTGNVYTFKITSAKTIYGIAVWATDQSNSDQIWQTKVSATCDFVAGGTYTIKPGSTHNNTRQSDGYTGTWESFSPCDGYTVPTEVLNGTNIMFYVEGQYGDDACITNGSDKTVIGSSTRIESKKAAINVASNKIPSNVYVTNNCGNWVGTGSISKSNIKAGGYYKYDGTWKDDPKTLETFSPSSASITEGTASVNITVKGESEKSAYAGQNFKLYSIIYVDSDRDGCIPVSTSDQTYTLNTSSLTEGTYTVQSVLTDGHIYYLDKSFTLTVAPACTPPTVSNGDVTNITNTTVTLGGSYSGGDTTPSKVGIKWVSGSGKTAGSIEYGTVGTSFTVDVTGLQPNTTYTYKAITETCNATQESSSAQSFTTAPGSIYVRGPIMGDNGDGGSSECWNNASYYEMQNNGSNVFTKTFNPSGNYCDYGPKEFVLTMENNDNHKLNPDWFGSKTGCQKSSRQGQGDNFESTLKYSNADELTLTVTWNGNNDYSISLVKTKNQPTDLYIKGPLVDGNWDGGYKQPGYTASGNTYVFTFNARTGGGDDAFEFCISSTQGDKGKIHYTTTKGTYAGWDFKDTQEGKNFVASDQIVTRDNFPIKVTVTYVGGADYDFTLDVESNGCTKPTLSLTMPYSTGKTYNQITANAQITNMGTCTINEFGVEAFSDASCEHRVSYKTGSTSSTDEQHLVVTGLTANTKYWFRAYAKTDDGDTYSSVVTDFTRVNAEKMSATNITSSSATLQGKALTDGGFATELKSNAIFKYGTTNVVGDAESVTSSSKAIGSVITYDLSDLAAGTTYYYWFCPTTTDGSHPTTPNYSMNSFTTNNVHSDIVLADQSVCVGANITLEPTCSTATNGFTYESKNTSFATVDANGVVHGVAAGTATITVTTKAVSGYDVATKDITVTVNAGPVITVTPASPKAYEVITLGTQEGGNMSWAKTAGSAGAYFVGADGTAISGTPEAATESIKLKAPADSYTITATPAAGSDCPGTADITVVTDTESCN